MYRSLVSPLSPIYWLNAFHARSRATWENVGQSLTFTISHTHTHTHTRIQHVCVSPLSPICWLSLSTLDRVRLRRMLENPSLSLSPSHTHTTRECVSSLFHLSTTTSHAISSATRQNVGESLPFTLSLTHNTWVLFVSLPSVYWLWGGYDE